MSNEPVTLDLVLEPADNRRLANLSGQFDENIRLIEERLAINVSNRGNAFYLKGPAAPIEQGAKVLSELYGAADGGEISREQVHLALRAAAIETRRAMIGRDSRMRSSSSASSAADA